MAEDRKRKKEELNRLVDNLIARLMEPSDSEENESNSTTQLNSPQPSTSTGSTSSSTPSPSCKSGLKRKESHSSSEPSTSTGKKHFSHSNQSVNNRNDFIKNVHLNNLLRIRRGGRRHSTHDEEKSTQESEERALLIQHGGRAPRRGEDISQHIGPVFPIPDLMLNTDTDDVEKYQKKNGLSIRDPSYYYSLNDEEQDDASHDENEETFDQSDNDANIANFPTRYFEVALESTHSFKHRKNDLVSESSYKVSLKKNAFNQDQEEEEVYLGDIENQLHHMFQSLLREIGNKYKQTDLVRVFITHEEMVNTNIVIGPDYLGNINVDTIMSKISEVIRSNSFIPANQGLKINVAAIHNIKGLKYSLVTSISRDLHLKKCVIMIKNNDHMCLPRAIAVAIAREKHMKNPNNKFLLSQYKAICKTSGKKNSKHISNNLQTRTAVAYMKKALIPLNSVGTLDHIPLYEEALNIGITVIAARGGNKRVYRSNTYYEDQIFLYYINAAESQEGHFSVISKITGLLRKSYYCDECCVGFNNRGSHKCKNWCNACDNKDCFHEENILCPECNTFCRSRECFQRHKTPRGKAKSPPCDVKLFCPLCFTSLHKFRKLNWSLKMHKCENAFCQNCKVTYSTEEEVHRCYMRSIPSKKCAEKSFGKARRFIFYDFESMLKADGTHEPNLVVACSICENCGTGDKVQRSTVKYCSTCGNRCKNCEKLKKDEGFLTLPCPKKCGKKQIVFSGPKTVELFCEWLFSNQHKNVTVMAHNARSYDNYFIYGYLITNGVLPEIVFNGCKIMYLRVGNGLNIRLLDSLNFLPMPLAALPKSFGLRELKKGYFPHLYNNEDTMKANSKQKLQKHPDIKYYDKDSMSTSKREDFQKWYDENGNKPFDFMKEITSYCISDVNILLNACWEFRRLFMISTGPKNPVDPFDYITIASVCMGTFRSKFLPEKWNLLFLKDAIEGCQHESIKCGCVWKDGRKLHGDASLEELSSEGVYRQPDSRIVKAYFHSSPIALLPVHGYARHDNYSMECLEWLKCCEKDLQDRYGDKTITIRQATSADGEKKVFYTDPFGRRRFYRLDGYYEDKLGVKYAFEFNGCWYHGCERCFPRDRETLRVQSKTLSVRYKNTIFKSDKLKELGFNVKSIWGCEFIKVRQMQTESHKLDLPTPLTIRDCFYGGRTNAICLRKDFHTGEKGGYVDFCSLYPYVLKYECYPIGHPVRMVKNFPDIVQRKCSKTGPCTLLGMEKCQSTHSTLPYMGIVKVKILPPKNVFFPVLPVKINGKLMFPLCVKCAREEGMGKICTCSDIERSISGTWCTPELNVALGVGYKILEIQEVLIWEKNEKINCETGRGGLFTEYINMFLKIKTQASGYPSAVRDEKGKKDYIEEYEKAERVTLDDASIEKNPGLRSIGKLALNSFYGKFGQRTNMKKTIYVTDPGELYSNLSDVRKVVKDFHVIDENMVVLEYCLNNNFIEPDSKTNVVIAAFCTSYARIKLWRLMNKLGERVLYHDTDSVIYRYYPWEWKPEVGKYLGDLTDELLCKEIGCEGCERGHWIVEYVSCGPKNYAYRLNTGEVVCKVRGFSLNYSALQKVNLDTMKYALEAWKNMEKQPEMMTVKTMILRNKLKAVIYSSQMSKSYGVVYNKRTLGDNYMTFPYGFEIRQKEN